MSEHQPHIASEGPIRRVVTPHVGRWLPPILLFVAVVAFVQIDARLKASPYVGYYPEDAGLVLVFDDFGRLWGEIESSEVFAHATAESGNPFDGPVLSLRQIAGFRMSPARWKRWFRGQVVFARSEAGAGVCMRPGLLVRVAAALHGLLAPAADNAAYRKVGERYYGLQDGFLIVSRSPGYLAEAFSAPLRDRVEGRPAIEARGILNDESRWGLQCDLVDNARVSGWVDAPIAARSKPLLVPAELGGSHLVTVSGSRLSDIVRLLLSFGLGAEAIDGYLARLRDRLPDDEEQFSLVVMGVDTSEVVAVPELFLLLRGSQSSFFDERYDEAVAYEWDGMPGRVAAIGGEKLSLCVLEDRGWHYVTTQEPTLRRNLRSADAKERVNADVMITVDWAESARVFTEVLRVAAEYELIPRMGVEDVKRDILPWLEIASGLGTLSLVGNHAGDRLLFGGNLIDVARADGAAPAEVRP